MSLPAHLATRLHCLLIISISLSGISTHDLLSSDPKSLTFATMRIQPQPLAEINNSLPSQTFPLKYEIASREMPEFVLGKAVTLLGCPVSSEVLFQSSLTFICTKPCFESLNMEALRVRTIE
jgi:hypothetical protein